MSAPGKHGVPGIATGVAAADFWCDELEVTNTDLREVKVTPHPESNPPLTSGRMEMDYSDNKPTSVITYCSFT